jgi:hypothetical protein
VRENEFDEFDTEDNEGSQDIEHEEVKRSPSKLRTTKVQKQKYEDLSKNQDRADEFK